MAKPTPLLVAVAGALFGALLIGVGALRLGGDGAPGEPTLAAATERYAVRLSLDAAAPGDRVLLVEIRDAAGRPVAAEEVTILPTMAEMGHALPAVRAAPEPGAAGRYRAAGEIFPMPGGWEIDVRVRAGGRSETARFSLSVE